VLDLRAIAGLALGERFPGAAPIGDVDRRSDVSRENPGRREARMRGVENPAVLAVVAAEPVLHVEGFEVPAGRGLAGTDGLAVLGMHAFEPAQADLGLERPASVVQPRLAEVG